VMVNYSLALLAVLLAILGRRPRVLLYAGLAVLLGAGLAAFFLLPAAYERKWVNIGQVLSEGVRPQDNFLFTEINDADHNRFNLLASLIASAEVMVLMLAAYWSRHSRRDRRQPWPILVAWGLGAALLMLPFTLLLWSTCQNCASSRFPGAGCCV